NQHDLLFRKRRVVGIGDARRIHDANSLLPQNVLELRGLELLLEREVDRLEYRSVSDKPAELHDRGRHGIQRISERRHGLHSHRELLIEAFQILGSDLVELPLYLRDAIGDLAVILVRRGPPSCQLRLLVLEINERLEKILDRAIRNERRK